MIDGETVVYLREERAVPAAFPVTVRKLVTGTDLTATTPKVTGFGSPHSTNVSYCLRNSYLLNSKTLDEEESHDMGKSEYVETTRVSPTAQKPVSIRVEQTEDTQDGCLLTIPKVAASSSSETLTGTWQYNILTNYLNQRF